MHINYEEEFTFKINCKDFEKLFKGQMETRYITNSINIDRFSEFEKGLNPDSTNYYPDVRAKIVIFKDDGTRDTLCINGGNAAELNGKPMIINDEFVAFIKKIE